MEINKVDRNYCNRTLSGEHIWEDQRRFSVHGESLPSIIRCIACGMVNDLEKDKNG
jgi:hypothetical protein